MRFYAFLMIASTLVVACTTTPTRTLADEGFSVVIDGRTGQAFLRNDGTAAVDLDGYLLRSPQIDVFDPGSWASLQDNPATPGWTESVPAGNRLGEANLFGSTSVGAGQSINIGAPYMEFAPTEIGEQEPGLDSIEFSYSLASGGSFVGDVEFINRNTLVLVVDPNTGIASLENQSEFDISIDSYLIRSVPAVLDADGWMPLEEGLGGAGGWVASDGLANRIAEGNLFGSTFLAANGGSLSLGAPIDPLLLDDETDLELEFTLAGIGSIQGSVLFAAEPSDVLGDYNGDFSVNAADYTVWRDHLGQTLTLANENPSASTPGVVDQEDYNFWKSRFGATSETGSGGGSGIALGLSAVPEPTAGVMAGVCGSWFAGGAGVRRERRRVVRSCSGVR